MDPFQLMFGFSGRINRAKFWVAGVINIVSWLIVSFVAFSAASNMLFFFIIFLIVMIPWVISGTAIGIKRLHDRDKSGWWLLVFYVLPAILNSIAGKAETGLQFIFSLASLDYIAEAAGTGLQFVFGLAGLAVSIWGFVELGCLRGTAGPNKFGSNPLAS